MPPLRTSCVPPLLGSVCAAGDAGARDDLLAAVAHYRSARPPIIDILCATAADRRAGRAAAGEYLHDTAAEDACAGRRAAARHEDMAAAAHQGPPVEAALTDNLHAAAAHRRATGDTNTRDDLTATAPDRRDARHAAECLLGGAGADRRRKRAAAGKRSRLCRR